MGLTHPENLAAWTRDQHRRHPLRAVRGRVRPQPATGVWAGSTDPEVLVVLDSTAPSSLAALLTPMLSLPQERVAVLAPASLPALSGRAETSWRPDAPLPESVRVVLSAGHYLPRGAWAYERRGRAAYVVSQHGVLTPIAPPLPSGCRLLAWSEEDAEFWRCDRTDVDTQVVGSVLLADAAARPVAPDPDARPVFLGQLHGAELPRRTLARAAEDFCALTGASYRPHPSERDRLSRRQHERWRAQGITIENPSTPLGDDGRPVVSVFSTGILEAAARGLDAWTFCPDPPEWLVDFWSRYRMSSWGGPPTPAPATAAGDPAAAIAGVVLDLIGDR